MPSGRIGLWEVQTIRGRVGECNECNKCALVRQPEVGIRTRGKILRTSESGQQAGSAFHPIATK